LADKIGKKEARFIIDNYKTMRGVDIAKKFGVTSSTISHFINDFVVGHAPDEALDLFVRCNKKARGSSWTDEETQVLIDNFDAPPKVLQKLLDRKFRSIRGKQRDLVGKAKKGLLTEDQEDKILTAVKRHGESAFGPKTKKEKKQQEREEVENMMKKAIATKVFEEVAPVENFFPELKIGGRYKVRSDMPGAGALKTDRRGKVVDYYPGGRFYLFDFGAYRETISQIDLLTGNVEARGI